MDFPYLDTCLTNKNEELVKVQAQTQAANRTYSSLLSLNTCHDINWRVRVTLYKTFIHSILP
jgi:hypothetical protein